jgi:SulP family sulfate permease
MRALLARLPLVRQHQQGAIDLRRDLSAGLTTAVMLVPQAMAYALLAGLDPIVGLYASTVPLALYGLLGTSRQLAVGPVAMVSLLVASGLQGPSGGDPARAASLAVVLMVLVGALQLGMGVFRVGFLVRFLSHPVVAGFTSAAALIIGASQLGHVLGLDLPRSHHVHETLLRAVQGLPDVHGPTLAVATASVVGLVGLKRYAPTVPRFLVVVGLAGAAVWGLDLASHGVKVVGQVPAGLPTPAVPALPWAELPALLPTALTIALVGFLESISVAQRFARQEGYAIDADQELVALGAANLGGSLFGGYPVTGGFSRTAVNAQAGAVSGLASLVTAGAVVLTLLFLTPLFTHLPKATLAAIILTAVAGLVDVAEARHLYRVSRPDLAAMGLTFVATLALGIEPGILAGVAGSLLWFIWRTSRPHTAELGYCPQIDVYRNLDRYPQAERIPGVVVLRIDGPLYFANTAFLQQTVRDVLRDDTRHLVLDANAIPSVDAQALDTMATVLAELADRGVQVWVSGARGPVRDQVRRAHLALDSDHVVEKVQDAVARIAPRPTLVAVEHPVG